MNYGTHHAHELINAFDQDFLDAGTNPQQLPTLLSLCLLLLLLLLLLSAFMLLSDFQSTKTFRFSTDRN